MIKKADILLGILLFVLCLSSLLLLNQTGHAGNLVTITTDGHLYGTYDLAKDQQIEIKQNTNPPKRNVVEIKDNAVFMVTSDCKNQVCIHQGKITRSNQTIVCLPNHVVISIQGKKNSSNDLDAISN